MAVASGKHTDGKVGGLGDRWVDEMMMGWWMEVRLVGLGLVG